MTSNRPYLIRALYEWLVDNALTPYLLVDADHEAVEVPQQFVSEGRIVLNIAPDAVVGLELGNEWISFSARFAGHPASDSCAAGLRCWVSMPRRMARACCFQKNWSRSRSRRRMRMISRSLPSRANGLL